MAVTLRQIASSVAAWAAGALLQTGQEVLERAGAVAVPAGGPVGAPLHQLVAQQLLQPEATTIPLFQIESFETTQIGRLH